MVEFSVVIPTYNRGELLRECVRRLAAQTISAEKYEVVVVDDGSSDPPVEPIVESSAVAIRLLRQPNQGPAAARNRGVEAAHGEVIVFIGDDILVPPDFLETHRDWRRRFPDPWEGMLGRADWPESYLADEYMSWLDRSGLQFGYRGLESEQLLRYYHFYTSNLAVSREVLLDFPFDEDFPDAAYEDTDLGMRLERAGFRLRFNPESRVLHDHFYDLEGSCRHRRRVGRSGYLFQKKHPESSSFKWIRRPPQPLRWAAGTSAFRSVAQVASASGDTSLRDFYFYCRNTEAFWEGFAEAAAADRESGDTIGNSSL